MPDHDSLIIRVHSAWDSWHSAEVQLADLRDLHWAQPGHAPRRLLHAFISCTDILSGDLAHTCDSRSLPHTLLVCVLKRHATPEAYRELVRCADAANRPLPVAAKSPRPKRRLFQLFS